MHGPTFVKGQLNYRESDCDIPRYWWIHSQHFVDDLVDVRQIDKHFVFHLCLDEENVNLVGWHLRVLSV